MTHPIPHVLGSLLLVLTLAPAAQCQNVGDIRVTATPQNIILCPGEEQTITIITEVFKNIDGESIWVRAGGIPINLMQVQEIPGEPSLQSRGEPLFKTDAKTGEHSFTVKAAAIAGTEEALHFFFESDTQYEYSTVLVITLSKFDWDKLKEKKAKAELEELDREKKGLLEAHGKDKVKKAIKDTQEVLGKLPLGKKLTKAKVNAAVAELKALEPKNFETLSPSHLLKLADARDAKFDDTVDIIGKGDDFDDPTQKWFADLKTKSVDELTVLLRQTEALNDAYFKQILARLGNPPDFIKPISTRPVVVVKNGNRWDGMTVPELFKGKDLKAERIVCFDPNPKLTILSGPDKILKELQNRLTGSDEATRKRLREIISDAAKAKSRCVNGGALVKYHAIYLERKLAGNVKEADDTRTQFLDRFLKELDKEIKEKMDRDGPKK